MSIKLIAPLHEYQKQAAGHVLGGKGNALFLEMGLGKTLTTLQILAGRRQQGKTKRTLILGPKRICEQVWRQEAEKWGQTPIGYLGGSPSSRKKMLENPTYDVYCMTYENLIWLEKTGLFPFDTVVLDELSKMKNSTSKRWRAFKQILVDHDPFVLGLTGTPAPNGYHDLWAQMFCLDRGRTLGPHKTRFLHHYFQDTSPDPRKYHRWRPKPGAVEEINERLKQGGVIAMRAADVLGQQAPTMLPAVRVGLSPIAAEIYEQLEKEFLAELPGGKVVLPEHASVTQMKLRQVASGFIHDDDGEPEVLDYNKVKVLLDLVEEMDGEPLMVVYTYRQELQMILEHLDAPYLGGGVGSRQADDIIAKWNRRELPVLLVQPQAAGHGLNLQAGGHHILFYSTDWNLETYQQVIARLNRQGQESPVFVRHMIAGDVERLILQALASKAGLQDQLMASQRRVA